MAVADGDSSEPDAQQARRGSWFLENDATELEIREAVAEAAPHDSSLHIVSFKMNASGVQFAGTRGVAYLDL